ncbi:putative cue domain-containing protein [Golovinomyces cichoracearum]|uniref:Putative cue domain-containing protein n=1 Tax=Golovinomyces cichoracearum TaxID=62708 RepID=A0A420HKG3_9PEZI|nr:putative cue domain-containing protein [Golovinomyces cichoracearum]
MSSNLFKPAGKLDSPVIRSPMGAESPTTVRPFEMDDDDIPDSGLTSGSIPSSEKPITKEDKTPVELPRPLSHQEEAENTLKEAFPSIDAAIVKAVLVASSGQIEPAFNALLGMSDPEALQEPSSSQQFYPAASTGIGSTPLSQLEADERYARQLASRYGNKTGNGSGLTRPVTNTTRRNLTPVISRPSNSQEERSFLEDDLPIIKDNLKKGFLEAQNKVNGWISILKKKIDGEDDEDDTLHSNGYSSRMYRNNEERLRRSDEYSPYDADPQVLGDDFAGIQLHPDGSQYNLADKPQIKPTSAHSKNTCEHQAPLDGSVHRENDIYSASPNPGVVNPPRKQSKWQPLTKIEPNPSGETDTEPFSLGDSDDEKETKDSNIVAENKTATTVNSKVVEKEIGSIEPAVVK